MPLGPSIGPSGAPMPFNPPSKVGVFDTATCFAKNGQAETLTATAYLGGTGTPVQLDVGTWLVEGYWMLDWLARDQANNDESYSVYLLGSNDPAWGNGNVEILQSQNFGSGRSIATIAGGSPGCPNKQGSGEMNWFPFLNYKSGIVYRYLRVYIVIAGTTPSATLNSWLTYDPC